MITIKMLIDRLEDWFFTDKIDIDPYVLSIKLLEKLNSNRKRGLAYNRVKLLNNMIKNGGSNSIQNLDIAIILLSSRDLIKIVDKDNFNSSLFISESGINTYESFSREMKNVSKKTSR